MEPGGSMPHSEGLSNNPYPESNQRYPRNDTYFFKVHSNIIHTHLRIGRHKGLFSVG